MAYTFSRVVVEGKAIRVVIKLVFSKLFSNEGHYYSAHLMIRKIELRGPDEVLLNNQKKLVYSFSLLPLTLL